MEAGDFCSYDGGRTAMPPRVSVVITAHDRKEFLLDAVNSAFEQDCSRDEFEVIVVKNFRDPGIDGKLEEKGVTSIFTEKMSFGSKIAQGIDASRGSIITFLDDDDLYTGNRISTLINVFSDSSVVYHHSSIVSIDANGREYQQGLSDNIPEKVEIDAESIAERYDVITKYKGHWYTSTISARADAMRKNSWLIANTDTSIDKALFFACINYGGRFVIDSEILTRYRIHESVTTQVTDYNTLMARRKSLYSRSLKVMENLYSTLKESRAQEALKLELMHAKLLVSFFSDEKVLTLSEIREYRRIGKERNIEVISFWAKANIAVRLLPGYTRKQYYKRMTGEFRRFNA